MFLKKIKGNKMEPKTINVNGIEYTRLDQVVNKAIELDKN